MKFKVGDKVTLDEGAWADPTGEVVFAHVDRDGDDMYAVITDGFLHVIPEDDMEKPKTVKYGLNMPGSDVVFACRFATAAEAAAHRAYQRYDDAAIVKLEY